MDYYCIKFIDQSFKREPMSLSQAAEFFKKLSDLIDTIKDGDTNHACELLESLFKEMFNFILMSNDKIMNLQDNLQELKSSYEKIENAINVLWSRKTE